MRAPALVDTNVLVYRFDARFPEKQARALQLLRDGIERHSVCLCHQTLVEFVAATTRSPAGQPPILSKQEALTEVEELMLQFEVLYPSDVVLRTALRGMLAYQLSWFDAHMWA